VKKGLIGKIGESNQSYIRKRNALFYETFQHWINIVSIHELKIFDQNILARYSVILQFSNSNGADLAEWGTIQRQAQNAQNDDDNNNSNSKTIEFVKKHIQNEKQQQQQQQQKKKNSKTINWARWYRSEFVRIVFQVAFGGLREL
jgi:hypothetical protein